MDEAKTERERGSGGGREKKRQCLIEKERERRGGGSERSKVGGPSSVYVIWGDVSRWRNLGFLAPSARLNLR